MLTGAVIGILSFLGFPPSWDRIIFFVLGVLVVAFGIVVRRRSTHSNKPKAVERPPVAEPLDDGEVA